MVALRATHLQHCVPLRLNGAPGNEAPRLSHRSKRAPCIIPEGTHTQVLNSEPAKLAIAELPNHELATRFLLVDDDYFAVDRALSTRAFFDGAGVPLHPYPIAMAHRPLPLLREAYVRAAHAESTEQLRAILTSGTQRAATCKVRDTLCRVVDRLPAWTQLMWREGTARAVRMETHNFGKHFAKRQGSLAPCVRIHGRTCSCTCTIHYARARSTLELHYTTSPS